MSRGHTTRAPAEVEPRTPAIDRELLFSAVDEVRDLPDGYAFRLPPDDAWARRALDFILEQRPDYPSLTFRLELEARRAALWLDIHGGAEVAAMLARELPGAATGEADGGCGCGCGAPEGACNVDLGASLEDPEPPPAMPARPPKR